MTEGYHLTPISVELWTILCSELMHWENHFPMLFTQWMNYKIQELAGKSTKTQKCFHRSIDKEKSQYQRLKFSGIRSLFINTPGLVDVALLPVNVPAYPLKTRGLCGKDSKIMPSLSALIKDCYALKWGSRFTVQLVPLPDRKPKIKVIMRCRISASMYLSTLLPSPPEHRYLDHYTQKERDFISL